jgi:hypothetical protein
MTILRGCPLYLVHLPLFRCVLCHLPLQYVAVCRLCVCVPGVPVCGLSGCEVGESRPDNPQTGVPLPSKCCILYAFFQQIQVLSILNMLHTLRFSLQNAVYFIMHPFFFPLLFKFYIQGVLKFKCIFPLPKG